MYCHSKIYYSISDTSTSTKLATVNNNYYGNLVLFGRYQKCRHWIYDNAMSTGNIGLGDKIKSLFCSFCQHIDMGQSNIIQIGGLGTHTIVV